MNYKPRKTVRELSNKSLALQVIIHAKQKLKRGKKPSLSFMGERNPRKALLKAWRAVRGKPNAADIIQNMNYEDSQNPKSMPKNIEFGFVCFNGRSPEVDDPFFQTYFPDLDQPLSFP